MPGLETPTTLAALKTRIYRDFQNAMKETPVFSTNAFSEVDSTTLLNTYAWLDAIPHMREWVGERKVLGLRERAYQIINKDYELTVGIKENDLKDGNIASQLLILEGMAVGAFKLRDDLAVQLMQNGHLATAQAYDGQNFYDTDHPDNIDEPTVTQSNYFTSTALNAANLQLVRSRMMSYKGANGKTMSIRPNVLKVPPALEKTAAELVKARTLSTGGENVQAGMGMTYQVIPDLAGQDTTWYLDDEQSPGPKAFILQRRQAPRLISKTKDTDDGVFYNKEYVYGVDARMGAGYGLWARSAKAVA